MNKTNERKTCPATPVQAFMAQIADAPGEEAVGSLSYAASIILPQTGWAAGTFRDQLHAGLSQPHNLDILKRELVHQRQGRFNAFHITLESETGMPVPLHVLPRPVRHPAGRRIVTCSLACPPNPAEAESGTGMAARRDAILQEHSRLFAILDVLPAYVALIAPDHCIRFTNRIFRHLFGESAGKPCHTVLRGKDTPCPSCTPFSALTSQAICIHEWASKSTNSAFRVHSYPFMDSDGTRAVLKVGINITAGVKAQHALDLSEQRYRRITDNLTVGVALLDRDLGVVTKNPRFEQWCGGSVPKGAKICDLLQHRCEGEAGCPDCLFQQAIQNRETCEREFSLTAYGQENQYVRLVACGLFTRKNEPRGVIVMLEDTTERHRLMERTQQLRRIELISGLAGGIAHEVNQPLSALHLYASGLQLLLEQGETVGHARLLERLALILGQADKIREIINHMRALVMQEEGAPPGPTRLSDAINGALHLVGSQLASHAVTVHVSLPATLPDVLANAVQLEQVIINLLLNAMHALDMVDKPGKCIRIDLPTQGEPGRLRFRIVDNGPGIQGIEDKLFDPFFTTSANHEGMGLGLSIVHTFVTGWGGEIRARNNRNESGASFTITLKLAGAENSP